MSISRWLHYLLAFTHRQHDVDAITRSISHNVWIEKLVFSLGNKSLQYMKCIVLYTSIYQQIHLQLSLSLLPEFNCVALWLYLVLTFWLWPCTISRFMSLACHNWDPCILLSLHYSFTPLRAACFLRCQWSPDVRGGGGARRGEIKNTYSATKSNVTLREIYKDIDG